MCRQLSRLARLTVVIAWLMQGGIGVALGDESQRGKRFLTRSLNDFSSIAQDLQQLDNILKNANNGDAERGAAMVQMAERYYNRPGSGGGFEVVVSTVIGASASPEEIQRMARQIPQQQRAAVGAALKKIPELNNRAPNIERLFSPPSPSEQQRDATRVEAVRQRVTEQKTETHKMVQEKGVDICR